MPVDGSEGEAFEASHMRDAGSDKEAQVATAMSFLKPRRL